MSTISKFSYNIVNAPALSQLVQVKDLYEYSFPEQERRPWDSFSTLIESGVPFFKFVTVTDNASGAIVGFYTEWSFPGAVYVEHFAVRKELRGAGAGSKILSHIVESAGDKAVVVEVEPKDTDENAPRRIKFYEKAGFTPLYDYEYMQPPYAPGLPEVPLMLMTTKKLPALDTFVIQLHTLVYNK